MSNTKGAPPNALQGAPPRGWERVEYAPLPWETHPIDTVQGPQGWGPFHGPWTPHDFVSPFWGIDATWNMGDNADTFGPGYELLTVFDDPSLDFVANQSFLASLVDDVRGAVHYQSTISNGLNQETSSLRAKILKAIGA